MLNPMDIVLTFLEFSAVFDIIVILSFLIFSTFLVSMIPLSSNSLHTSGVSVYLVKVGVTWDSVLSTLFLSSYILSMVDVIHSHVSTSTYVPWIQESGYPSQIFP